jgi:hypothetical protein
MKIRLLAAVSAGVALLALSLAPASAFTLSMPSTAQTVAHVEKTDYYYNGYSYGYYYHPHYYHYYHCYNCY